MKTITVSEHNKIAYLHGKTAKDNGYERISCPYRKLIAEWYWLAGYDGVIVKNFSKAHKSK